MKHILRIITFSMVLLVGCALVLPTATGTLESHATSKVKISKSKATITKGKTLQLKVKGTKKKVKWSSSKKAVATVNKKGKVTAKKAGKVTITAKIGKKKYRCKITVKNPVKISNTKATILEGETLRLEITGTKKRVTWSSTNKKIATVNKIGRVTAKKPGNATIIATVGNKSYQCKLTVEDKNPIVGKTIYIDFSKAKYEMFFLTVKLTDRSGTRSYISNQQRARSEGGESVMLEGRGKGVVTVLFDNEIVMQKTIYFTN